MPFVKRAGMDWSYLIDADGLGWHYDTVDHKEDAVDSPFGQRIGVMIVPEGFAVEAVAMFPDVCEYMNEDELEDFYDNRAHVNDPEELIDSVVLDGIKAKKDLGRELSENQQRALDPDDPMPGIRRNKNKTWQDFKARTGVTIKDKKAKK
jgi:hypothetical protein